MYVYTQEYTRILDSCHSASIAEVVFGCANTDCPNAHCVHVLLLMPFLMTLLPPVTGAVPHGKPESSQVHAGQKTRFDGNKVIGITNVRHMITNVSRISNSCSTSFCV
jgi:hypothetical protein